MQNIVTWPYVLRKGHSDNPAAGACAMDAVNWLVHGKHGDHPECACPIISAYVINGNDRMPDDVRQNLLPYLHRIAGSKSLAHEAVRMRILVVAAVRVFAANALEKAGFLEQAKEIRAVSSSVDYIELRSIFSNVVKDLYFRRSLDSAMCVIDNAIMAVNSVNAADAAANAVNAADAAARCAVWHEYPVIVVAGIAYNSNFNMGNTTSEMWQPYFDVLNQVLNAGPQGKPWSTDMMDCAVQLYEDAIT